MPFLRKPDLLPIKGTDFSIPSTYLPEGNNFPQNLQYFRGELIKRPGRSVLGSISIGAKKILHLAVFELTTGSVRLIRHTKTNVMQYNSGTGAWDDITGINDLLGADTDFFSSAVITESDLYVFVNNKVDNVKKYSDGGAIQNLGGSPPKASCIEYLTPYVLLGDLIESGNPFPFKIRWCDTGQPEVWTGGASGSQLLSDEPSGIRAIKKLRNYAMVYKEKSVYRGAKVSTSSVFDFQPFSFGKGLYSPRALADNGLMHFYMGLNDFHSNDGIRINDIGKPIREYLFNRLNRAVSSTCHAVHMETYKEIWFYVTIVGMDYPTEVWKYNYEMEFWYFDTVLNCITTALYKQTGFISWDQDTPGTWDQAVGTWDDQQGVTDSPLPVFGHDTGFVNRLDIGTFNDLNLAVDSRVDTKDYCGLDQNGLERDSRWMQLDVWAKGSSLKLYYSTDYGSNWTFVSENTLDPNKVEKSTFWFDFIAPHVRFRLQQDGLGKNLVLRGLQPYLLDAGEIKQSG